MSALPAPTSPIQPAASDSIAPPPWVEPLIASAFPKTLRIDDRITLEVRSAPTVSLIRARVADAGLFTPADMEQATASAYRAIAQQLEPLPANHPIRFWNYLPGIHEPGGTGPNGESLDRYMNFNAGRFAACREWLGGESAFASRLATASGVGHAGNDLVIDALLSDKPGKGIENPRQVPAYRYSRRYGPCPPCFARATLASVNGQPRVLVGGTASVRGEVSVHVGDLALQMVETLENLVALLQAADTRANSASTSAQLRRFTQVRVYYVQSADLTWLQKACAEAFSRAALEFVHADLCRQDLLVEIEGMADADDLFPNV